jgi:hypothetical protein
MGCTACTEPQCLYKGELYLSYFLPAPVHLILNQINPLTEEGRHIIIWVQGLLTLRAFWQMDIIFWDSLRQTKDDEELPLLDHKSIQMVYLTLLTLVSCFHRFDNREWWPTHTWTYSFCKSSSYHPSFGSEIWTTVILNSNVKTSQSLLRLPF